MTVRVIAVLVSVTLVVLVALEVPLAVTFARQRTTEVETELERDALEIGDLVEDQLERSDATGMAAWVNAYQRQRDARALVVDATGVGMADSQPTEEIGGSVGRSFADRPEIAEALDGRTAVVTRHSDTLDATLIVVAAPVRSGGRILGAVRVSRNRAEIDGDIRRYIAALAAIGVLGLLVAAGLGIAVGRWATGALVDLEEVAAQLGAGALDSRADPDRGPPEVRDLASRFNAMADRLGTLIRSSQDFAADASHQLRTPLTAMRLRIENLAAVRQGPGATAEEMERVLVDLNRLDDTIDALLAFTRLDRAGTRAVPVPVGEALRDRAAVWAAAAEESGVRLVVEGDALDDRITFDPNHLEQVLDNLIANALDVSPAGGVITLSALEAPTGDRAVVELHVRDQGPGLDADDRVRAFDRHWGRRAQGTGLGLAITARLCANNGATARLDAEPGGGIDAVVTAPKALDGSGGGPR